MVIVKYGLYVELMLTKAANLATRLAAIFTFGAIGENPCFLAAGFAVGTGAKLAIDNLRFLDEGAFFARGADWSFGFGFARPRKIKNWVPLIERECVISNLEFGEIWGICLGI